MLGAPSTRKSHCQPARPPPESDSSAPDTGEPIMPAARMAVMNAAIVRARSAAGNHRVR